MAYALPDNYGFDDLAQYEEARRNDFAKNIQDQLAKRRAQLAAALTTQGNDLFKTANPGILEDLNARGLSSSPSAVNQSQTDALKQIALANQGELNSFDNQATAAGLQGQQDALDSGLDLRRGQLEKSMQDAQANREEQLARDLAQQQGKNGITQSLIGLGGNLLTANALRGKGLFGGGGDGGGGLFSGLFGGGSGSLSGSALAGGGGSPASSLFPGGLGTVGTGAPAGMGFGTALGGAGLGYLGSSLGRQAFGGGNDVGGIAGTALGTMFGGPIGGGVGGFVGTGAQRLGESGYKGLQGITGNTIASTLKPVLDPVGAAKSVGSKVSNVVKSIGNFCFDAETPVEMKDGSYRPISKLYVGAETKGGRVLSVRVSQAKNGDRYEYKGFEITGLHAVKENGIWLRVKDSSLATPLEGDGIVWSIVTESHRIFIHGLEAADEHETDQYEYLDLDESLASLNNQQLAEAI